MDETRAYLEAIGTEACAPRQAALLDCGEEGLASLLGALCEGAPVGARGVDHRIAREQLEECLSSFARQVPEALLRLARDRAAVRARPEVLAAVSLVPGEEAAALLQEATESSDASIRWRALESMARRGDPGLAICLGRMLLDGDPLVAYEARLQALRAGVAAHLGPLIEALRRMSTKSGHYVRVMDAIEAICFRESLPLPEGFPSRLRAVELPPGVAFDDEPEHTLFPAGVELGSGPDGPFIAPIDWFVVTTLPARSPAVGVVVLLRDHGDERTWTPPGAP